MFILIKSTNAKNTDKRIITSKRRPQNYSHYAITEETDQYVGCETEITGPFVEYATHVEYTQFVQFTFGTVNVNRIGFTSSSTENGLKFNETKNLVANFYNSGSKLYHYNDKSFIRPYLIERIVSETYSNIPLKAVNKRETYRIIENDITSDLSEQTNSTNLYHLKNHLPLFESKIK